VIKFRVSAVPGFVRGLKKLLKFHNPIIPIYEKAIGILEADPYNIEQKYDIKKLGGVRNGDGQFRIRIGDWRIRYDIESSEVILYSFKNRKEGY